LAPSRGIWKLSTELRLIRRLKRGGVDHSGVSLVPEYAVKPYLSLWKGKPNLWIIVGDLPTDYFVLPPETHPRFVLRSFAERWARTSLNMLDGRPDPELIIGDPDDRDQQRELGDLLARRAGLVRDIADDDKDWDCKLDR
jgi:hypothetical protein